MESEDVIKFIGEYVGPDDCMYPASDPEARARIDGFLLAFENVIQGYYKYLTATSEAEAQTGKDAFSKALERLEEDIEGPFCLGETFSVAECYAAPWVHRFSVAVRHFRGDRLQDIVSQDSKVAKWMQTVLDRPSVASTSGPEDYLLKSTRNYFVKYITPGAPAEKDE